MKYCQRKDTHTSYATEKVITLLGSYTNKVLSPKSAGRRGKMAVSQHDRHHDIFSVNDADLKPLLPEMNGHNPKTKNPAEYTWR